MGVKVKVVRNQDGSVHGWSFWCPGCDELHVPRVDWTFNGDLDRPTFSPSILVTGRMWRGDPAIEVEERCHSFVRDGRIEFLGDCTHALAGQTVDLPDREWAPPAGREALRTTDDGDRGRR